MNLRLAAVKFNDFRNISSGEILRLSETTSLVGANETGKSNILRSISLINKNVKFSRSDATLGTQTYNSNSTPTLTFFFAPDSETQKIIRKFINDFSEENLLAIRRTGEDTIPLKSRLDLQEINPIFINQWKNITSTDVNVIDKKDSTLSLAPGEIIPGNGLKGHSVARKVKDGSLDKLNEDDIRKQFLSNIAEFIPTVREWKFDETNDYLRESIVLDEFITTPDSFLPFKNLFLLAGDTYPDALKYTELLSAQKTNLRDLGNYLDDVCKATKEILSSKWGQEVEIKIEPRLVSELVTLQISLIERGQRVEPGVRSDGLKWFVSFILKFSAAGEKNNIYIFDQPGDYLHPGGQRELLKRFKEVVEENQIIYATHSPFLIDRNNWKSVQFLEKSGGLSIIRIPTKIDVENDSLLRNSLGFTIADVGEANDNNVVVEGYWDKLVFQLYRKLTNARESQACLDSNSVSILDSEGAPKMKARVEELVEGGLNSVGIYDYDAEPYRSRGQRSRSLAGRLLSLKTISGGKVHTGEDLIPTKIYKVFLQYIKNCVKETTEADEFIEVQVFDYLDIKPGRLKTLKDYLQITFDIELKKELKDECWEKIRGDLEKGIVEGTALEKHEYNLARKILKAASDVLFNKSSK